MTSVQIVEQKNGKDAYPETAVALYGSRGQARELMERFKAGLKVKDASEHEYAALAHLALKHALDPFNGEAWIIPGNGIMVGIKGLRKMAHRQAREQGVRWWVEFHEVRNEEERAKYDIPEGAAAAILCHLRRSDHIEAYAVSLKAMRDNLPDMPYEMLMELLGRPPVVVGIGYVMPGEKSKMPVPQLVRKRAEAHAIKQTWDVECPSEGDRVDGEILDGEVVEEKLLADALDQEEGQDKPAKDAGIPDKPTRSEPAQSESEKKTEPPKPPTSPQPKDAEPREPERLKADLAAGAQANAVKMSGPATESQVNLIAMKMKELLPADRDRRAVLAHLVGVDSTKKLTKAQASALIDWLTGDPERASQEAQRVLRASLVDQGQLSLPSLDDVASPQGKLARLEALQNGDLPVDWVQAAQRLDPYMGVKLLTASALRKQARDLGLVKAGRDTLTDEVWYGLCEAARQRLEEK